MQHGLSGWELDSLLRRRLGQRVISAVATLRSLSRLVTSIESMPIEDHIQTKVRDNNANRKMILSILI